MTVLHRLTTFGLLLALAACAPRSRPAVDHSARDFTFFVLSDPHVGAEQPKAEPPVTKEQVIQKIEGNLERMRALPGTPLPHQGGLEQVNAGAIGMPRGLFVLGDLVDGHKDAAIAGEQWAGFEQLFPRAGVRFGERSVPVFAIAGNHDGAPSGPARQGLIERNRAMMAAGQFAALSDNGAHFAINWNGVHLIAVNLCAADSTDARTPFRFGRPGPGSWNDPQGALGFLKDYLRKHVGRSGEPVILMQHYGFDAFSIGDWYWWTPRQRCELYDTIRRYNIVAILHGHDHHADHYRWPDGKRHAEDLQSVFGGKAPASPRQYHVISCGGVCWVLRVRGDELIAAHVRGDTWSTNPVPFVIPLSAHGTRAASR